MLLVAAPVALVAAALVRLLLAESRDQASPRRLDVPGAVTATTGLALLIFTITQAERLAGGLGGPSGLTALPRVAVPLAAAVALLAAFVAVERRHPAPLVRWSLLRRPGMVAADLAATTLPVGLGALLFLGTLHLQRVLGFTALETGLAYLVLSLPVVAASPAASFLAGRYGRRAVAAGGLLLQVAGLLLLVGAGPGDSFLTGGAPGFVLVGAGAPIAWVPLTGGGHRRRRRPRRARLGPVQHRPAGRQRRRPGPPGHRGRRPHQHPGRRRPARPGRAGGRLPGRLPDGRDPVPARPAGRAPAPPDAGRLMAVAG